ncbi:MAG: hypothetical protein ABI556_05240 [Gemmatimonadales bacterium]
MRKLSLLSIALATVLCAPALQAQAGSPNTTPGAVTRVTLVRIIPGHADMFWQDVRQNGLPIWQEQKKRGLITDYSVATKTTTDDPKDWNVAISVSYKNWATLDTFGARNDSVTLGHYGTAAARTDANMARIQHGETVSSFLIRNQTVNPWR